MQWVESTIHSGKGNLSQQYTRAWKNFFAENPKATRRQVVNYGKKMWNFFTKAVK